MYFGSIKIEQSTAGRMGRIKDRENTFAKKLKAKNKGLKPLD